MRGRDAARRADRLGARHPQPAQPPDHPREREDPGDRRRRGRHRLRRCGGHGARLPRGPDEHRDRRSARPAADGGGDARRGDRRAQGVPRRADAEAPARGGLIPRGRPPRVSLIAFAIYLITDGREGQDERAEQAISSLPRGAVAVQLRAPALTGGALHERALRWRALTTRLGAPLFLHDRVDIALAVAADGAHLPARGLPARAARRIAPSLLLAASTHSLPEARMAVAGGADLCTFGPVWPTASHPGAPPVGVAALAEVARSLAIPVFALGGVDAARAGEVAAAGARAACLRAILDSSDPAREARAIHASLRRAARTP
ncbi:MAG: thiamine phosphate synthase [Myxococcales bacterium]|nr:thiamine phosphate synthase [Myxococcales bacterium]